LGLTLNVFFFFQEPQPEQKTIINIRNPHNNGTFPLEVTYCNSSLTCCISIFQNNFNQVENNAYIRSVRIQIEDMTIQQTKITTTTLDIYPFRKWWELRRVPMTSSMAMRLRIVFVVSDKL